MRLHEDAPLVSIIIPAYNAATRIAETLRSVIVQDYLNIEIIVVNDCSTDETSELARDVLEASGRAHKIIQHKNNRGVSAARNTGIDVCSGKYICFMDADDLTEPYFITRLMESIERHGADIAICGYKNRYVRSEESEVSVRLPAGSSRSSEDIVYLKILKKIDTAVWSMMVGKKLLDETGLRFVEGCTAGEDVEFTIKAFSRAQKISIVSENLYIYVHHADMGSVKYLDTSSKRLKRYRDITDAMERVAEYLLAHTSSDLLRQTASNLMLPDVVIRRLTALAREGNMKDFMELASDNTNRMIIRRSCRSFFQKPELFFKAALLLLAPKLYYRLRAPKCAISDDK